MLSPGNSQCPSSRKGIAFARIEPTATDPPACLRNIVSGTSSRWRLQQLPVNVLCACAHLRAKATAPGSAAEQPQHRRVLPCSCTGEQLAAACALEPKQPRPQASGPLRASWASCAPAALFYLLRKFLYLRNSMEVTRKKTM